MDNFSTINKLASSAFKRAHQNDFGFIARLKLELIDRIRHGQSLDSDAYRALLKLAGKAY